jgi:hypothetical protein
MAKTFVGVSVDEGLKCTSILQKPTKFLKELSV